MIRINNISITISDEETDYTKLIQTKVISLLNIKENELIDFKIFRESIDARRNEIKFIYVIDVQVINENKVLSNNTSKDITKAPNLEYQYAEKGTETLNFRPVIAGFGPSGMFSALILAQMGYKPLIIERGCDVDARTKAVNEFWTSGRLNSKTNVQFGEGGAGTFSDGKLTTRIKDEVRALKVLNEFTEHGAPSEILYKQKPHIGTDILKGVVKSIRNEIIRLGGEIRFETKLTDIIVEENKIKAVIVNETEEIKTDVLVLGIGHSARDTYELLYNKGLVIQQKPFAVGVRIEHPQSLINKSQYKKYSDSKRLGPADYKLTYKASNGRGVYSFCMCPGGEVVASSSEDNMLVTNGMSEYSRDKENANSGILVQVNTCDFESEHPLAGVEYQRKIERAAFDLGGRSYKAPCQLVGDFLENKKSKELGTVKPTYKPGVVLEDMRKCLPDYVVSALKEGILFFDKKIHGFAMKDAIITGVETRSSAPVRLLRNEEMSSNIDGVYLIGEGAGYAGGIISSAVDGIKCAEVIAKKFDF